MISFVNQGPHTNYSQFMLTFKDMPYFDKKFVCFGRCVDGSDVLDKLEKVETQFERPVVDVEMKEVGILMQPKEINV